MKVQTLIMYFIQHQRIASLLEPAWRQSTLGKQKLVSTSCDMRICADRVNQVGHSILGIEECRIHDSIGLDEKHH